jgi:two-component sensor histidine kinase
MTEFSDCSLSRATQRLAALAEASAEVAYQMSPDWSTMRQLAGGGFLADTVGPSRAWMMHYIPAEEQERVTAAIDEAIRTKSTFSLEHRVRRADGTIGWTLSRAVPILGDDGAIEEWFGAASDVTSRREAEEYQQILLAELQHRVRNILTMVRSIVRRSGDGVTSTGDYIRHLDGRLSALARTQVLLTRGTAAGIELEDILRDELIAQAASEAQFLLSGPPVRLAPKTAEIIALAVHELTTNATKYGALAQSAASIEIRWRSYEKDGLVWIALGWRETGVSILEPAPRRKGFGTELITQRIPYELKGVGRLDLKPGGLDCTMEFPLVAGDSILQTTGPAR